MTAAPQQHPPSSKERSTNTSAPFQPGPAGQTTQPQGVAAEHGSAVSQLLKQLVQACTFRHLPQPCSAVLLPCRYGPKQQPPIYTYYDGDANLFGARKPHLPQEFTLGPDELINKVELQWDPISMRCAHQADPVKRPVRVACCPGVQQMLKKLTKAHAVKLCSAPSLYEGSYNMFDGRARALSIDRSHTSGSCWRNGASSTLWFACKACSSCCCICSVSPW